MDVSKAVANDLGVTEEEAERFLLFCGALALNYTVRRQEVDPLTKANLGVIKQDVSNALRLWLNVISHQSTKVSVWDNHGDKWVVDLRSAQ